MGRNLWKVDRRRRFEDSDSEAWFPDRREAASLTVGATLRLRREERGEDLQYIAQVLRIRLPYLKAIEEGRVADLPGPTYAVGFLRTYADYLELDSQVLINRFKAEIAGLNTRTDLHFPSPMPEGKIPSGAMILMALVLAASIYGAWMYLSSEEQQIAEIVPQLPSSVSAIVRTGEPDAAPVPLAGLREGSGDAAGHMAASQETPIASDAGTSSVPAGTSQAPAAAQGPDAPAAATVREGVQASRSDITSMASETAARELLAAANAPVPEPPGTRSASENRAAPDAVDAGRTAHTESEGQIQDVAGRLGRIYGQDNANARIVLEAVSDSWVEVRDRRTDELLLTRVLFKGDRYLVPDRGGLALLTGNAGGLRILVDGREAPSLGKMGMVRRNVPLDPGRLMAGNGNEGGAGRSQ